MTNVDALAEILAGASTVNHIVPQLQPVYPRQAAFALFSKFMDKCNLNRIERALVQGRVNKELQQCPDAQIDKDIWEYLEVLAGYGYIYRGSKRVG